MRSATPSATSSNPPPPESGSQPFQRRQMAASLTPPPHRPPAGRGRCEALEPLGYLSVKPRSAPSGATVAFTLARRRGCKKPDTKCHPPTWAAGPKNPPRSDRQESGKVWVFEPPEAASARLQRIREDQTKACPGLIGEGGFQKGGGRAILPFAHRNNKVIPSGLRYRLKRGSNFLRFWDGTTLREQPKGSAGQTKIGLRLQDWRAAKARPSDWAATQICG